MSNEITNAYDSWDANMAQQAQDRITAEYRARFNEVATRSMAAKIFQQQALDTACTTADTGKKEEGDSNVS